MYVPPPVLPRFILMRGSARLAEFTSLLAIGRHLGHRVVRELFYQELNAVPDSAWPWLSTAASAALRVQTLDGEPITWRTLFGACRELDPKKRIRSATSSWNGVGPVPGTGRIKGYRFKRRPRTTQELRLIAGVVAEDGEPVWRARRKGLPTVWDDLILHKDHSWKRHRQTQWK